MQPAGHMAKPAACYVPKVGTQGCTGVQRVLMSSPTSKPAVCMLEYQLVPKDTLNTPKTNLYV